MIDRSARDRLALLVRRLASKRISTLQFDDLAFELASEDAAIDAIRNEVWLCYDDFTDTTLEMDRSARRVFARLVLFLRSDLEFQSTLKPDWSEPGSLETSWPFSSRESLELAQQQPAFPRNAT